MSELIDYVQMFTTSARIAQQKTENFINKEVIKEATSLNSNQFDERFNKLVEIGIKGITTHLDQLYDKEYKSHDSNDEIYKFKKFWLEIYTENFRSEWFKNKVFKTIYRS